MLDKKDLEKFFYKARTKTYAADGEKAKALLDGSDQLEYTEGDWFYRDIYYTGENNFTGLEAIYYKQKPVFSMSYYGNWGKMTEETIDKILRGALIANTETRGYKNIKWEKNGFVYTCSADTQTFGEISGSEKIEKDGKQIYYLYYAGNILA